MKTSIPSASGSEFTNHHFANAPLALIFLVVLSFASVAPALAQAPPGNDPNFTRPKWVSLNTNTLGVDGTVSAFAVDDYGNLYVGGEFRLAGTVPANYIARWDGHTWHAVGPGPGGQVRALAVSGSTVYAAGYFPNANGVMTNNVANWNGNVWAPLSSGMNREVRTLAVSGTNLFAGGSFTAVGGMAANSVVRWDGKTWLPLGAGTSGGVSALAVSGTNVYAGGTFTNAGGIRAVGIAVWDGNSWSALGSGLGGTFPYVAVLAADGADLYAGGSFTYADGMSAVGVAKWNGNNWTNLGSGLGAPGDYKGTGIAALAVSGTNLYAGGFFGEPWVFSGVAKWDGNNWQHLGHMIDGVSDLAIVGNTLYAGGPFGYVDAAFRSIRADNIAAWDGNAWAPLFSGINVRVSSLAVGGDNVYAGGSFTHVPGGLAANYIGRWDGHVWSTLGSGMNGPVYALAADATDLYAGGAFTHAGGTAVNYIAQWNGSNWLALGAGLGGPVHALALDRTNLYAAGNRVVSRWNGNNWSALGGPLDADVRALALIGTRLFAGGYFGVAQWDGTEWSVLPFFPGGVDAMVASETSLYVGGYFGLPEANHIAKWDGTSWSGLGMGIAGNVYALLLNGTNLYVGAGESGSGAKISKWDGNEWSELGTTSGVGAYESAVEALAMDGRGHLFAAGNFYVVDTVLSPFIVQANLPGLPIIVVPPQSQTAELGCPVEFTPEIAGYPSGTCLWAFNGTSLGVCGADGVLSFANVDFSQSGSYTFVVTNVFGSVTSAPAMLNVIPVVERRLVPALSLSGQPGSSLWIEYADALGPGADWVTLDVVQLTDPPQFHFDVTVPLPSQRFYRARFLSRTTGTPLLHLPYMVPAITLKGNVGDSLQLDYLNAIGSTDAWLPLSVQTLTNTSQLYFDLSSVGQPRRLYRIVPVP